MSRRQSSLAAVLVVDVRYPTPHHDAASLRMLNLLILLQEIADRVVLAADDGTVHRSSRAMLEAAGITVPDDDSVAEHLQRCGRQYEVILLSRIGTTAKYLALARACAPDARIVFDTSDLASVRGLRGARVTGNRSLLRQALEAKRDELYATRAADCTLVVSTVEQRMLQDECPSARIHVLSCPHETHASVRPRAKRSGAVFVGAFPHQPNADAMEYFCRDVYPRLRAALPDLRMLIVGTDPPDWLRARPPTGIVVTGHVPDIGRLLDDCRVSVAPLRYGAGVKGKVLLSMSRGLPVVGSSIAAEGLGARDGEEMLVADDPGTFIEKLVAVYEDDELWNHLSEGGRRLVERDFSLAAGRRSLRELVELLGVAGSSGPGARADR